MVMTQLLKNCNENRLAYTEFCSPEVLLETTTVRHNEHTNYLLYKKIRYFHGIPSISAGCFNLEWNVKLTVFIFRTDPSLNHHSFTSQAPPPSPPSQIENLSA